MTKYTSVVNLVYVKCKIVLVIKKKAFWLLHFLWNCGKVIARGQTIAVANGFSHKKEKFLVGC